MFFSPDIHVELHGEARGWLIAGGAVFGAMGTVGAVLYALYRDKILEKARQPKLHLEFDPHPSEPNLDLVSLDSPKSHWARFRVTNAQGRRSAHDVEVLVTEFRPKGHPVVPLDTRSLRWSNLFDSAGQPVTRVHLPPGVTRFIDLLAVYEPGVSDGGGGSRSPDPDSETPCMAVLQVWPEPSGRGHWFGDGHYELRLAVAARDTDAAFYTTEIEFDGIWRAGSEPFWDHLKIGKPSAA